MTISQIIHFLTKPVTQFNNCKPSYSFGYHSIYLCTVNIETFKMCPAFVLNSFVHPLRDCYILFEPIRCMLSNLKSVLL